MGKGDKERKEADFKARGETIDRVKRNELSNPSMSFQEGEKTATGTRYNY